MVIIPEHGNVTRQPLYSNGSLYIETCPALAVNNTYDLYIEAYDTAFNIAYSYRRTVNLYFTPTPIDPWITMPIVITSSFTIMVSVILFAVVYDSKQPQMEQKGNLEEFDESSSHESA